MSIWINRSNVSEYFEWLREQIKSIKAALIGHENSGEAIMAV